MSAPKKFTEADDLDGIVISGVAGVFPNSDNVEEFKENLLAGNDMLSKSARGDEKELSFGLIKTIDRFDHSFFRMTHSQAETMTVASRLLLEKTFEAILDAGYNPEEIKGKNIAVIGGIWECTDEGDPTWEKKVDDYTEGFGRMIFMMTNRLSNLLDVHGPSYPVNTACSSSLYAMDHAVKSIQSGQCEGAIVCSANFCFATPYNTVHSHLLSSTGSSAPFDVEANGYVRAEAVGVLFLQRKRFARRIYANVIHTTTNCDGFKEEGFAFPSVTQQKQLYKQFYEEINMDPNLISYIEAHGTGTKVGDVVEATSIDEYFCANRTTPLKVGSLKSCMGHAEAAAGLCSLVKMVIAFETGVIPANLRYKTPNPNIKGLFNGHLEVVSKPVPLEGDYFAMNSFGIGGANGHIVLSPHKKLKREDELSDKRLPWIVTASGRTEEAVDCIFNDLKKNQNDPEYIRLWHEIFKCGINGHLYRGYTILQKDKEVIVSKKHFAGEKRPIWFVFSGMGSQWPTMGKSLMSISTFAESIQKSHQVMQSKGLDLMKIITSDDPQMFENILNSFVGIAAIQIALVDLLKQLNIKPDGIIGHSVGELGCAYADGCFTAEQMILAAYYRGIVSLDTELINGTMAAVGQSYEYMKTQVPPEIDIACHNSSSSCTISGPTEIMKNYIKQLEEEKIFVRAVNSSNIAFHSRYIKSAGPKLMSHLEMVIPEPKLRSEKWICTSAPQSNWDSAEVKYCSAEYHTNNLLNPVLFEESCKLIPNNAITIEIAPHGLLNAILKRSLPTAADNIPLTLKNHENSVEYLLNALGRLYEVGCDIELSHLYPPIEFPVSKTTPMISPSIKWQHEEQWLIDEVHSEGISQSTEKKFIWKLKNEGNGYIRDHVIDGRNLYPGFGYLWLVVETVAMIQNKKATEVSVVFENVHFEHALVIRDKGGFYFNVSVHKLTKHFEVKSDSSVVATGRVRLLENTHKELLDVIPCKEENVDSETMPMLKEDFYKELRLRGYHYKGLFKNVEFVNTDGKYGEVSWGNNFVCFMDTMAQMTLLQKDCRELLVPIYIDKVVIDFEEHFKIMETLDKENPKFPVNFYPEYGVLQSGGIQMSGWKSAEIARQKNRVEAIYESYEFIPYFSKKELDLFSTVRICSMIALKSTPNKAKAITYELLDQEYDPELVAISSAIAINLKNSPSIEPIVNVLINSEKTDEMSAPDGINLLNDKLPSDKSAVFVILSNIQNKIHLVDTVFEALKDDGFIITLVPVNENVDFENLGFNVCFSRIVNDTEKLFLLGKKTEPKEVKETVQIRNDSYSWISEAQTAYSNLQPDQNEKLVIFADKEPTSGILGFFNCWKEEQKQFNVSCFFILDENAPAFSLDDSFYKSQLEKNLLFNVYKDGEWGGYWHPLLELKKDVEPVHAFCTLGERGNLSSFKWVQGPLNPSTYENPNGTPLVHVYYSSLNFKDVMLSVGRISATDSFAYNRLVDCYQGDEFSGKNENGERLMGMVCGKGIATIVEPTPELTWRVPDNMTLEEAASIPVIYSTLIYAFFIKIQLEEGCSILIHSGSGGIGQAAINICLHYKCKVFTTVGTPEKVEFIKKTFPQIPENHIGNSRDTSFLRMIMKQTNGKGVDLVLNSLAEDKLRTSVRCVARGGHFLEIGKFDMARNNYLELGHFLNDVNFYSVQLDVLLLNNETKKLIQIRDMLQDMLDRGIIKPINRTVFQIDEVESAFRYMASGKHTGKLVIKIRDEDPVLKTKPTILRVKSEPRVYFQKDKSYVVLGGLGGFGIELADWLIIRGARHIVLSSRTGIKNGYQSYKLKLWRSYGAKVVISISDISQESGIKEILETANLLGPVAGVFNLALVLKDDVFPNQTEEHFKTVVNPKALATEHLDRLTRTMCPDLEHFVVFSSIVCGNGNIEQTNYGFANAIMERICELRRAENLPGLAIQWGAIGEVGYVSELFENNISIPIRGFAQQRIKSCLETLNNFMILPNSIVCTRVLAEKRKIDSDIISTVANILGIKDLKTISLTWTLTELGMDSILGIELKQILEAEFDVFLTPEDLRTMTFAKLYRLKEEKENKSSTGGNKVTTQLQFIMDEKLRNQPVFRIPLIDGKIQEKLPVNENPTVFVFPGLEGLALSMEPLAKNLHVQSLCFQYHFIEEYKSLQSLCDHFSSQILKELEPENEFCLVGHSGGAVIAIQVAKILEKEGRRGRICLIEGSPVLMELGFEKRMKNVALEKYEEYSQNQICTSVISTIVPSLPKESYSKYIENATGWESKKKTSLSILSKITRTESIDHQLFDTFLNMFQAISHYKQSPGVSLQSPCVLIRCVETYLNLPVDESYGLAEYFKNPVAVHLINDVDHFSIISHSNTAEIIANFLPWKKH